MSLQFINFKKKIEKNEELQVSFKLADKQSLAIINKNYRQLDIFKNIFKKVENYRGNVLINNTDVREKKILFVFDNIGMYSNFSLYQNFKFLLRIHSVKISKETLLKYFEDLRLDSKRNYVSLDASEKEKAEFLLRFLISKEIFLLDLSKKNFMDIRIISEFIKVNIDKIEKNVVVLSKDLNEVTYLMDKFLIIDKNKQEYYGDNKNHELVSNLVVLKLSVLDNESFEDRLTMDYTIVNNKLILEKKNLEAALYYFVSNDIQVESITDFVDNDSLYMDGE
ncbi:MULTISPECIES: hypothetical protein [unclassified Gemella]|uniref:hypothetical protein n=1 Tax=unclassified Gemella TaxID=2624949 RepID=UPI0010742DDF|nr:MULTISPECIES: hypothetical protein [unclassified Gemella]MBF0710008.1 hypothetical protein [Gemella sp. GL1.1]MBF0746087.1 hypothetical protein [Gemella sp. 19428wG2_WT2a]NYS27352.1 hypothetical protein [Gemella sp. GL1]TFU60378.1 hypothetical protein E4T67_00105 [Gemella sp. WT2a]